jgi:RNase LS, bacterial toxin DBD domain
MIRISQYRSGSLVTQGRDTPLYDDICSAIEAQADATVAERALRFSSQSEEEIDSISKLLSPELIASAEREARDRLQAAFDFLDAKDKLYLVCAFVLLRSPLELPEYSPMVMPTAKAFEGFVLKLLVGLGICSYAEVQVTNFHLGQKWRNQPYKVIANKSHDNKVLLEALENQYDKYRSSAMHSGYSNWTLIPDREKAEYAILRLVETIREAHGHFVI